MERAGKDAGRPTAGQAASNSDRPEQIANGVWRLRVLFVNVYFIRGDDGRWILVDAGLKGAARKIMATAEKLFGKDRPPAAIVLTHGHFDHVGALPALLKTWPTQVYAHTLELPYLTGHASYPPADPFAGGGMMSWMSFLYPNDPINLSDRVEALPKDGSLPFLSKWRYIHTPGHAPGHISLFRDTDGLLIAGDAFVTTRQESAFSILFQRKQLSGPPKYFTYDWEEAEESVKKLQMLNPLIAATGHGVPIEGHELAEGLAGLAKDFKDIAVPGSGRYVKDPATVNRRGVATVPRRPTRAKRATLIAAVAAAAFGAMLLVRNRRSGH